MRTVDRVQARCLSAANHVTTRARTRSLFARCLLFVCLLDVAGVGVKIVARLAGVSPHHERFGFPRPAPIAIKKIMCGRIPPTLAAN
jgi:hypothetical protein